MVLDASIHKPLEGGASFPLSNRIYRALWMIVWLLAARWTPPPLAPWRNLLLRAFGARIAPGAKVYGSTVIWSPRNLTMERYALVGPGAIIYNQDHITIGERAIVSQRSHLCTGSHAVDDPDFQLFTRPIVIGPKSWVASEAFVGPGVTVGEGAVLAGRGVAFKDLEPWSIYRGNPATFLKKRSFS